MLEFLIGNLRETKGALKRGGKYGVKLRKLLTKSLCLQVFKSISLLNQLLMSLHPSPHENRQIVRIRQFHGIPLPLLDKTVPFKELRIVVFIVRLADKRLLLETARHEAVLMPDVEIHRPPDLLHPGLLPKPPGCCVEEVLCNRVVIDTFEEADRSDRQSVIFVQIGIQECRGTSDN